MIIHSANFITSAARLDQCPADTLPEVAFVGRSNVGKSSLINKLLSRRRIAHTSGQPGKTQTLNYYLINERFYLVDLPGYGYARVSKAKKAGWGPLIDAYLGKRGPLRLVVQLVDLRHPPSREDRVMQELLSRLERARTVAGTKADKLKQSELARQERLIRAELPVPPGVAFIPSSAQTGAGIAELWSVIEAAVGT